MTLVLKYVARSDRGLVRSNNQDAVYAGPRLLAVADGMGGHAAGEVASKIVIAALAPLDDDEPDEDLLGELRGAVQAGNAAISEVVAHDPELDGMGTTLTAILFAGNRIGLVNIGDSRTYRLAGGELTQVSVDHSEVAEMVARGLLTAEQAARHPYRHVVTRVLGGGGGDDPAPDFFPLAFGAGDRVLVCSDGLTGELDDAHIAEILRSRHDPQDAADHLVAAALVAGGRDNVTVIVVDAPSG